MWRVSYSSYKWYAVKFDSLDDELDNIKELAESGDVVILCQDLDNIADIVGDTVHVIEEED